MSISNPRAKIAAKQHWQSINESIETSSADCYAGQFENTDLTNITLDEAMTKAAMAAISGKTIDQLSQLRPEQLEQLKTSADLFPDALVNSELGEIPKGWDCKPLYEAAKYVNGNAFKAIDFSGDSRKGLPIIKIAELKAGLNVGTKFTTGNFHEKYFIQNGGCPVFMVRKPRNVIRGLQVVWR